MSPYIIGDLLEADAGTTDAGDRGGGGGSLSLRTPRVGQTV